jgi:Na+-transporting NADH:ubiquinone oxidoreductase subunit NqrB
MLVALLAYGALGLGFPVGAVELALVLGAALSTQALASGLGLTARFEWKSAAITALSLAILLRAAEPWVLAAAGAFAVASKYLLRSGGKHVWNPSALAIAVAVLATGQAWLSPGQWGSTAWFAFAIAGLGGLVVFRAERSDVTWAFMAFWCALVLGRSTWIGEPLHVPLYRLQDGALLLFTFFMISDPKTTPDSRVGRVAFAGVVALAAFGLKFGLQIHAGLVFALVACAPIVPLLDRWLPGRRYAWPGPAAGPAEQGAFHAPNDRTPVAARARHRLARA